MGFETPLSSSRDLKFDAETLTLRAECQTEAGTYRWSELELDDCVYFGTDGNLQVASGWHSPNWRLLNNRDLVRCVWMEEGTFLRAECAIEKGIIFKEKEWHTSRLNLNDWVRNNNGTLEFVHPKYGSWIPEWVHVAVDIADKIPNAPEDVDEAYDQAEEDFQGSIGDAWMEGHEKEWLKGTYPLENERLVRRGK